MKKPRFEYGTGPTVLALSLPMMPWLPDDVPIGGGEKSAAGIPSNFVIRHEPLLHLTLRVTEAEWPQLVAFLRAVDSPGSAFTFIPDQTALATSYTCYLESPSVASGESYRPIGRDEEYPEVYLFPMTVRRSTSTVFDVRLHG